MSAAHYAIAVTAAVTCQHHGQTGQANVVSDLLERSCIHERSDAVGPGTKAGSSHSRSNKNHVLFRNAGVDKAVAHLLTKWLERFESEVAGQEYEVVAPGVVYERAAESVPHSFTSVTACW